MSDVFRDYEVARDQRCEDVMRIIKPSLFFADFIFQGIKARYRRSFFPATQRLPHHCKYSRILLVCEDGAFDDMQWRIDHQNWCVDGKWECALRIWWDDRGFLEEKKKEERGLHDDDVYNPYDW